MLLGPPDWPRVVRGRGGGDGDFAVRIFLWESLGWGVEGCEECPHSPGAGLESSLPGVVYTRELLERKIRVALPSAGFLPC